MGNMRTRKVSLAMFRPQGIREQRRVRPCLQGEPKRAGDNSTPANKNEENAAHTTAALVCEEGQPAASMLLRVLKILFYLHNYTEAGCVCTVQACHVTWLVPFLPQHSSPHICTGLNLRDKS